MLHPAYPNPFNASAVIPYELKKDGFVTLDIYNTLGEQVSSLFSSVKPAGTYQLQWQPGSLPGGVYVIQLTAGDGIDQEKLIYIK